MPITVNPDKIQTPKLPDRLLAILSNAAQEITAAIVAGAEPPPAGTFAGVAQLSATLQELARLVPVQIYAVEAMAAVTGLGVLPEPLESVRQQILAEILPELPPGSV